MTNDPLEIELAALRPLEPSAKLRESVSSRIYATRPAPRNRNWASPWWIPISLGGLAAVIFGAMYLAPERVTSPVAKETAGPVDAELATAFDSGLPSYWSYRTAITQAPEELDSMLDSHRLMFQETKPERARVLVFARYDSKTNPW